MRSPAAAFDLRVALSRELQAAIDELDTSLERPKAVHRCRVRVKRARALARIGRACAPGLSAVFNDTARGVMRTLGHARNLDALAGAARDVGKRSRGRTAAALARLAAALEAERAISPGSDLASVRVGLRDLLALAQVWPPASPRQIKRGAERIARRARRAYKSGRGANAVAERHEWRKREKDRLFAATLLDESWRRPRRRKASEKLDDALGLEHDVRLLLARVAAAPTIAGENDAGERAAKALRKTCKRLANKAGDLGARVHAGGA